MGLSSNIKRAYTRMVEEQIYMNFLELALKDGTGTYVEFSCNAIVTFEGVEYSSHTEGFSFAWRDSIPKTLIDLIEEHDASQWRCSTNPNDYMGLRGKVKLYDIISKSVYEYFISLGLDDPRIIVIGDQPNATAYVDGIVYPLGRPGVSFVWNDPVPDFVQNLIQLGEDLG